MKRGPEFVLSPLVDKPLVPTYVDNMTEAVALAAAAGDRDPQTGLRAVAALRSLVDQLERAQVRNARADGWSYRQIAGELGVSRQAVHKKHAEG